MQGGRYSPIRQKAPFMVCSDNRQRGPGLPYMFGNHDGSTAFVASSAAYSQRGVSGLPSNMVPLLPTGYPSRSVESSYNVISSATSRPRVLPVHTVSVGVPTTMRHYPLVRSQAELAPVPPHMSNLDTSNLYRSNSQVNSVTSGTSLAPTSRTSLSTSHTPHNSFSASTSTSPHPLVKEDIDSSRLAALALQPPSLMSLASSDPNVELMTSGFKLQQKWMEKDEMKNLLFNVSCLMKIISAVCLCGDNSELAWNLCKHLRLLTQKQLPQDIHRLKLRIHNMVLAQHITDTDVAFLCENVQNRQQLISQLRDVELGTAKNALARAKRRRKYNQELESVSSEILMKKTQKVFKKEFEQEKAKLHEAEECLRRWKKISHLRKAQVDCILLYTRDVLQSLKDPMSFLNLTEATDHTTEKGDDRSAIISASS